MAGMLNSFGAFFVNRKRQIDFLKQLDEGQNVVDCMAQSRACLQC